jgi:hypothetical protein
MVVLALAAPAALAQSTDQDKPPVLTPNDYPPIADDDAQAKPPASNSATAPPRALSGSGNPPVADDDTSPNPATMQPQALSGSDNPPAAPVEALPAPVEVGTLGASEGTPVGLLDSGNGGFDQSLWSGSPRAEVESLLQHAPLASADPPLRSLTERLILTKADAPTGPAPRAFTALRIEKLLDAGLIDQAGALAAQASVPDDPDFARTQADALLLANSVSDVCGDKTATRLSAPDPFWLQLRAYCAAASGDQPTADLTRAVLAAQGNDDKGYDTLVDDVLGHKSAPPGPIAHPTALHVFLLLQAGLPVTGDAGTAANLLAARDPRNPMPARLAAAGRIARTGAMSAAELKKLADAQDIPLGRIANAKDDAPKLSFFEGQTVLRRAAQLEPRPQAKAALVAKALALGEHDGLLPLAACLQSDVLASVEPMPDLTDARLFARALLLAGLPDVARQWLRPGDVMLSVADLAAPGPARDAELSAALGNDAVELTKNPPDPDPDRSYKALVLGLADVLGRPMPPEAKAQAGALEAQNWGGKRPDSAVIQRIEQASGHPERKGEALLLILDQLRGLRDLAPDATIEFVRLLESMNIPDTARAVALEAAMLYVPPPAPAPVAAQ